MPNRNTILMIDDSPVNRSILGKILSNYPLLQAGNGKQALEVLEKEFNRIALIMLDLVMPVMDGYAFLNAVHTHPVYSSIPIIITTSQGGRGG